MHLGLTWRDIELAHGVHVVVQCVDACQAFCKGVWASGHMFWTCSEAVQNFLRCMQHHIRVTPTSLISQLPCMGARVNVRLEWI